MNDCPKRWDIKYYVKIDFTLDENSYKSVGALVMPSLEIEKI